VRHPLDLVVVDYLQKLTATYESGKRYADRVQEVSEVARGLKQIAREFDVPVLALAQLSRAVESRADKLPQFSDLRDSGELEQEADLVLLLYRDEYYAGYEADGTSKSERPGTADVISLPSIAMGRRVRSAWALRPARRASTTFPTTRVWRAPFHRCQTMRTSQRTTTK